MGARAPVRRSSGEVRRPRRSGPLRRAPAMTNFSASPTASGVRARQDALCRRFLHLHRDNPRQNRKKEGLAFGAALAVRGTLTQGDGILTRTAAHTPQKGRIEFYSLF